MQLFTKKQRKNAFYLEVNNKIRTFAISTLQNKDFLTRCRVSREVLEPKPNGHEGGTIL